jgi:arsenate reductase (glutaredoxin)
MENKENEIILYFDPREKKGHNTLMLAKTLTKHIKEIEIAKEPPTETQLKEILQILKVDIRTLINQDNALFKSKFINADLDEAGWLTALVKNPELIRTPIAIKGKRGVVVETPSDVLGLDPDAK